MTLLLNFWMASMLTRPAERVGTNGWVGNVVCMCEMQL